jgi:hypothetical protein
MNARGFFKPKGYTQSYDCSYTVASTSHLASKHSNSKGCKRRVFPLPPVRWAYASRSLITWWLVGVL